MKKILIVDDEHEVAQMIQETLSAEKRFEVVAVYSSLEAVELLKKNQYDLVITDLIMPDFNGIELTQLIFENYPKTKVLACSGGGDSGRLVAGIALDQALNEGADNSLLKPFSPEELVAKVNNLF